MKVELIYFDGCPNADPARKNLKTVVEASGINTVVHEWEQSNPKAPKYARHYGSPTILINGVDIAENPVDCCAAHSCRFYERGGAPTVQMIKSALEAGCCA